MLLLPLRCELDRHLPGNPHVALVLALCLPCLAGSLVDADWLPFVAKPDHIHPIPRVPYAKLTFQQFYLQFRQQDRPLIITDVPHEQFPCFGGLGSFNDSMLLDCKGSLPVHKMVDSPGIRKGVQLVALAPFKEFVHLFAVKGGFNSRCGPIGPVYSDSGSIRDHCRSLWRHLRFPAFFTGQMRLHAGRTGVPYSENPHFPAFYFSQKGARQTWHMDEPRTELWSAICRGRKRYRVAPLSRAWRRWGVGVDLGVHLSRPGLRPLRLPVWEGTAAPGEVLYLPAGALHAVLAEEDTVNIVDNFVDASGLGPVSGVNARLLEHEAAHAGLAQWLRQPGMRTRTFDGGGVVLDANATARGFPSWADLVAKHGLN